MEKEQFSLLYKKSFEKMNKVNKETSEAYNHVLEACYTNPMKHEEFIGRVLASQMRKVNDEYIFAMERGIYEHGYQKKDPYFLCNFKAIYPLIKRLLYDNQITTYQVKKSYDALTLNNYMKKLTGNAINIFLMTFNESGEEYYKVLEAHGISLDTKFRKFRLRGIPKSVCQDILGKMRGDKNGNMRELRMRNGIPE